MLQQVTDAATEIFTEPPRRAAALTYLKQRGIDGQALRPHWILGYAPPGWTRLVDRLASEFSGEALIAAGVARLSSRGTLIDAFRERAMFGIRDLDGRVAGFVGRDLSGHRDAPKYLNTRRHDLYNKSRLLFGLYEGLLSPDSIQPVIAEGPLDVLAIAARQGQTGSNALLPVAPSGTAFTAAHAELVADTARKGESAVLVAMDGDSAGRHAALAVGDRLGKVGLDVRVAVLPTGEDPASYLARPNAALGTFSTDSGLPLLVVQVEHAIARRGDAMQWPEGRIAALRDVSRCLSTYPPDYVSRQTGFLASAFDLQTSTVARELVAACSAWCRGKEADGVPL